jgi:DNA-directed RNA polymerase specialized sigma24 family protein
MLFHSDRTPNPDKTLADQKAARRGDARAFGRLVLGQQNQIYSLSFRVLGDEQAAFDTAQAAVRQAARNLTTLPAGEFRLWLMRWVVSACQERLRQGTPEPSRPNASAATGDTEALQGSLGHLPLGLRLALILVDVTGLDYAQAATVLGASREQVGRCVAEARARLMAD